MRRHTTPVTKPRYANSDDFSNAIGITSLILAVLQAFNAFFAGTKG